MIQLHPKLLITSQLNRNLRAQNPDVFKSKIKIDLKREHRKRIKTFVKRKMVQGLHSSKMLMFAQVSAKRLAQARITSTQSNLDKPTKNLITVSLSLLLRLRLGFRLKTLIRLIKIAFWYSHILESTGELTFLRSQMAMVSMVNSFQSMLKQCWQRKSNSQLNILSIKPKLIKESLIPPR